MREFVYFSRKAWTTGNFKDLMKAGRLDIACHFVIHSFFISNARREIILHLFFYGPPDPPKHIEIHNKASISKKDVADIIRKALFKYRKGKKIEALPGIFIEKKSLIEFLEEKSKEKKIYLLDPQGEDVNNISLEENSIFVIGDQKGLPLKEKRRIKRISTTISLGKKVYFASQALIILQYLLDRISEKI
jgi:tRNA pseudouridine-54 N-methylase